MKNRKDSRLRLGIKRGLKRCCPNCGKGKIFEKYIKTVDQCPACEHDLSQYPSDDAPPYLTIFLVGHIGIPIILWLEDAYHPDIFTLMTGSLLLTAISTIFLLPFIKGFVLGFMWAFKMGRKKD